MADEMGGERFVFGSSCCWWDGIEVASQTDTGLPCCPHCGGVPPELRAEIPDWASW